MRYVSWPVDNLSVADGRGARCGRQVFFLKLVSVTTDLLLAVSHDHHHKKFVQGTIKEQQAM